MTDHDVRELLYRAASLAPTELDRPPVRVNPRRRRSRWVVGVALAGVVALGGATIVAQLPGGQDRLAQDGPTADPTAVAVSATADDLAPLEVSTGPVMLGEQSWRTHELRLTNAGEQTMFLGDVRFSQLLPDEQLLVGMGCGYGIVDDRATGGCRADFSPGVLRAGQSALFTVELWRDLPGMAPLVEGAHAVTFSVLHRTTTPFLGSADRADATESSVSLVYDVRDAAASGHLTGDDSSGSAFADRYLGVWRGPDGTPAEQGVGQQRTFELRSHRMPAHCDWDSAVVLQVPWPLGSTYAIGPNGIPLREYMRDVDDVFAALPGAFAGELELDATLPDGARSSGYTVNDVELWFGPDGGDQFAYLVRPEGVERWPRALELIGCR